MNLKNCLTDIKLWMTENFLKLNEDKREIMEVLPFYAQQPVMESFCMGNEHFQMKSCAKSLGVYFDEKLSFDKQINETIQSVNFRLKNMARVGSKLSKEIKLTLIQSYILGSHSTVNVMREGRA